MKIIIIIPTYNEREIISQLIDSLESEIKIKPKTAKKTPSQPMKESFSLSIKIPKIAKKIASVFV